MLFGRAERLRAIGSYNDEPAIDRQHIGRVSLYRRQRDDFRPGQVEVRAQRRVMDQDAGRQFGEAALQVQNAAERHGVDADIALYRLQRRTQGAVAGAIRPPGDADQDAVAAEEHIAAVDAGVRRRVDDAEVAQMRLQRLAFALPRGRARPAVEGQVAVDNEGVFHEMPVGEALVGGQHRHRQPAVSQRPDVILVLFQRQRVIGRPRWAAVVTPSAKLAAGMRIKARVNGGSRWVMQASDLLDSNDPSVAEKRQAKTGRAAYPTPGPSPTSQGGEQNACRDPIQPYGIGMAFVANCTAW